MCRTASGEDGGEVGSWELRTFLMSLSLNLRELRFESVVPPLVLPSLPDPLWSSLAESSDSISASRRSISRPSRVGGGQAADGVVRALRAMALSVLRARGV